MGRKINVTFESCNGWIVEVSSPDGKVVKFKCDTRGDADYLRGSLLRCEWADVNIEPVHPAYTPEFRQALIESVAEELKEYFAWTCSEPDIHRAGAKRLATSAIARGEQWMAAQK